jgi:hypothetical protein
MRTRFLAVIGCLSLAAAALALTHAPRRRQAQKPATPAKVAAPAKAAIPRLADGHPDFQGFYDVSTMDAGRPAEGVKNLVLTEQEAVAMEKYEAQRQVKNDAPLAGDRSAPPSAGKRRRRRRTRSFSNRRAAVSVGGYNNFWLAGGDHVIRVDGPTAQLAHHRSTGRSGAADEARGTEAQRRFLAGAVRTGRGRDAAGQPPGAFDGPESRPLAERCLLGSSTRQGRRRCRTTSTTT